MNTLVKFELAKLLKEKGFDVPCREGWVNYLASFTGETKMPDNESNLVIDRLGNSHLIERPTIAEVVMWLYEKYRIWISVCCTTIHNKISKFHFSITFIKDLSDERNYDGDLNKIKFNSPTEAYEAAIEYTLKNLI